jgi:hypothetical protein
MRKAIVVPDLAFTSRQGQDSGKPTGYRRLKAKLKYLQYRNDRNGHIPQEDGLERWVDRGLGQHYRDILKSCDQLGSRSVLAWTWVISPAPDLMALVPEAERQALVKTLTEQVVEAYYLARGAEVPEYAYVLHDRLTRAQEDGVEGWQQLHTHVVLPGTVPTVEGTREPFYNRASKGHVQLLQAITTRQFEAALDRHVGPEWRRLRPEPGMAEPVLRPAVSEPLPGASELDHWFGARERTIS